MSLVERVAELRDQDQRTREKASINAARQARASIRAQELNLDPYLRAFDRFEQKYGLKKALEKLAESERLDNPRIYAHVEDPDASVVELRLEWRGQLKREHQEGVIAIPPKGIFRVSIIWTVDNQILIRGSNTRGIFNTDRLGDKSYRKDFEEEIAKAYLSPQWKEELDQLQIAML